MNIGKPRKATKQILTTIAGLIIILVGIAVSQFVFGHISSPLHFNSHKLPSNYADNRSNFTASMKDYADSSDIANSHGDVNQVANLISSSIASSNKVSDDFLNYLDPQLKDEYRNKLIRGEQLFLDGLNANTPTDTIDSPSAKLQTQGIQLENEWTNWWNSHHEALTNKAFAN